MPLHSEQEGMGQWCRFYPCPLPATHVLLLGRREGAWRDSGYACHAHAAEVYERTLTRWQADGLFLHSLLMVPVTAWCRYLGLSEV